MHKTATRVVDLQLFFELVKQPIFINKSNCMKHTFTNDLLIKFIYQETTTSETIAIRKALRNSKELRKNYEQLRASYQQLPKVKFNARKSTLQSILKYSKENATENCA